MMDKVSEAEDYMLYALFKWQCTYLTIDTGLSESTELLTIT